jgi:cathepsin A (carboxypeptidase C)
MRLLASSLLLGAATAAIPPYQHVLKNPLGAAQEAAKPVLKDSWAKPLEQLGHSLNGLTDEAKAVWDEVAMHFPEQMSKASFFSAPKPHVRKPDSVWDYHVKGADIQK